VKQTGRQKRKISTNRRCTMSVRVELDGEPSVSYSATVPELRKIPRFALFDDGRHLFPQSAYADAIARANGLRACQLRTLGARTYRVTLTKKRPAFPASELFHVPVAEVTFTLREPK
jgi:hypothetical protein